jgi:hypothetical protein
MKVLCSQEVVSPHRCGPVPGRVTVQASAPPGAVVCPPLVTPGGRLRGYDTQSKELFYALSSGSFRQHARNFIAAAQERSQQCSFSYLQAPNMLGPDVFGNTEGVLQIFPLISLVDALGIVPHGSSLGLQDLGGDPPKLLCSLYPQ